jgi:hypothetical protein
MKKYLLASLILFIFGSTAAYAIPADIKSFPSIGTTSVTVKYVNVRAAKQFKFQLYDRRQGRTNWRKVDTFQVARKSKTKTYQRTTIGGLKVGRQYRLRYKPIYDSSHEGVWSDYASFETKEEGVYITLNDNDSLLSDDIPYIYVFPDSDTTAEAGPYVMTAQDDGSWLGIITNVSKNDVIHYVLARNYAGPRTFEEFTPDDVTTYRTVTVDTVPFEKELTVDNWRWLETGVMDGNVSSDAYAVADRSTFVLGAELSNGYLGDIGTYSTATFASMAELGLQHVVLPYASRMIVDGTTADTTETLTNYPTDSEYETLMAEAEAAGLTPIMKIDFPIDPADEDVIRAQLNDSNAHSFYSTYLTRWREAMNDGVDFAIDHNIAIVVLDTSFYDTLDLNADDEQYYFNYILEHDILPVVASGYDGILTTDQLSTDSDFSWYESSYLDWLGASWYPASVNELTTIYEPLSTTYGNKPLFFYRLGAYSIDGANSLVQSIDPNDAVVDPDQADTTYITDFQDQADMYELIFRAIADDANVIGAMAPEYSYSTLYDKSANIRGKTARLVWARWAELFN